MSAETTRRNTAFLPPSEGRACVDGEEMPAGTYMLAIAGGVRCDDAPGALTLPLTTRVAVAR